MIDVANFSKAYEKNVAVHDLSFHLLPGQVLGLVGRNGAGKTTTLRALTGIIPASAGSIRVAGFDILSHPVDVKRNAVYVPDDPRLFEDLTVQQHLQFQASVYGIDDPSHRIAELLDLFELEPKRHAAASSLSRGMRQKLAISAAYLAAPKALLLDEPMTGLDPQAIRALKASVAELATRGVAIIISSHLLAMVEDICSHVLVLDAGRSKFFGTADELRKRYLEQDQPASAATLEHAFFLALTEAETAVTQELSRGMADSTKESIDPLTSSNSRQPSELASARRAGERP